MADPADGYARNLLIANRDFLRAELVGYITENYPDLKYSKTACKKDVGYLVDAVSYDLTYGGNWQTVNAGEAYHVGASSNLPAAQKAATLAAYGYLKGIMQTVGRNITVTPGTQSAFSQIPGTAGDAGSATAIGALLDDFINIVDNGTGSETITYPSITGAAAGLQTDHSLLGSAASTVKTATTNWITANFPNLTYDSAKCERDMGYIVDALIHDITHGGNVKSREAALSYVNDTVGSPYLTQKTQTVATINYGLTVIQAVLAQTAPAVNYQVNNGDNSTAVVAQYFNATLTAESVYAEITGLTKIITDAITAGVATDIPARLIRNTLIKVSTGKYYEVLPIIVPAECCIIGDELRATQVQPRKSNNSTLTTAEDYLYSNTAIERVEAIIGDIVEGVSVTCF